MFSIKDIVQPATLEEAYRTLVSKRNNRILGGSAFLRLGSKRIATAVDLSRLDVNEIKEHDGFIEIGALTTLRELEVHSLTRTHFSGTLANAVSNIVGVQLRNIVTVGASVFAKYGFSDLLTVLLALDAEVALFKAGRMPLNDFMQRPRERDILTKIFIKNNGRQASYQCLRKAASDFPLVNVAVSRLADNWVIAVGARPKKAEIAHKASEMLSRGCVPLDLAAVCAAAADELTFGTNARASAEYRRAMCNVLVKRAVTEVLQCK